MSRPTAVGPWYVVPHPKWPGGKSRIAHKPDEPWGNFGEIAYVLRHYADLVAAAPDLFEALVDLRAAALAFANDQPHDLNDSLRKAGAALNKASGHP